MVGIAVMMSISMIAPAFAANPWKDLWSCITSGDVLFQGTEGYVKGLAHCEPSTNPIQAPELDLCETKRGTAGHMEFKDLKPYDGQYQDPDEQTRCHKTSFWT